MFPVCQGVICFSVSCLAPLLFDLLGISIHHVSQDARLLVQIFDVIANRVSRYDRQNRLYHNDTVYHRGHRVVVRMTHSGWSVVVAFVQHPGYE